MCTCIKDVLSNIYYYHHLRTNMYPRWVDTLLGFVKIIIKYVKKKLFYLF